MKIHAFRIKPGQDLKIFLEDYIRRNRIKAAFILTCVGSLNYAILRMADTLEIKEFDEKFEILSLVGTFSVDGCHLHISLSKKDGSVIGGHLKKGCIIDTTAEVIMGESNNLVFNRKKDANTGFKELMVKKKI